MDFLHDAGSISFSTSSCIALFLFGAWLIFFCLTGGNPSRMFTDAPLSVVEPLSCPKMNFYFDPFFYSLSDGESLCFRSRDHRAFEWDDLLLRSAGGNKVCWFAHDFPFPFPFISCRSPMGAHNKNSLQSKADQTVRIATSVFVSNFLEGYAAKDLWKVCNDYGTVVDVFIPIKKSKVGKRFTFVRFIKVINLDRLIANLNTIWIGRFHLFANRIRFERPKKPNLSPHNNAAAASSYPRGVDQAKGQFQTGSYVNVVNGLSLVGPSASVLVLDDSCVAERDLSNHVMSNVKDVSSISNLRTLIMEEGFSVVNLVDERIVWVDIEGIPLNVWSRETFTRIGKNEEMRWILKIMLIPLLGVIFKSKVYMVRAKELFTWSPIFLGQKEMEYTSDEDSDVGPQKVPDRSQFCEEGPNDDRVSDVEEVSETNFGDNSSIPINHIDELEKQQSEDPFIIYRLLRKQPGDESHEVSLSLSHPPGFTPDVSVIRNENGQSSKEIPFVVNAKVMNNSQDVYKEASCDNMDPNRDGRKLRWHSLCVGGDGF
nr:hypothetical protein [Tanacetum cinerariifolium]